jgi:hypothetical protein
MSGPGVGVGASISDSTPRVFSPSHLAGLALWLAADSGVFTDTARTTPSANGDPVGGWADQSTNGFHPQQATSGARPTYRTSVGGRPGIEFDGSDDWLDLSAGAAGLVRNRAGFSAIVIGHPKSFTSSATFLMASTSGSNSVPRFRLDINNSNTNMRVGARRQDSESTTSINNGTTAAGTDTVWGASASFAGGTVTMWNRAAMPSTSLVSSGNSDNTDSLLVGIGRMGSTYGHMLVRELICYSRALADWELARLARYLSNRWGVSL